MPKLVWNEEKRRIMVIDFERAEIVEAIRKRKRLCGAKKVDGKDNMVDMMKEDPVMRS